MASIWHNLGSTFRQLRWKLTLSYTAVTVGALLVAVLVLGTLLFSRILVPHNVLTPDAWIWLLSENTPPAWRHALAQSPVDTGLLSLLLEERLQDRQLQITDFDLLRIGDLQLTARTFGRGDVLVVGRDGTLLGASSTTLVPKEAVGQPLDPGLLPGLEAPLQAALAGSVDPERLFVTLEPNRRFFLAAPLFDHSDGERRVLAAAIVHVEALPTASDLPANTLAVLGRSLLIFLLAAGLVGAAFGALTAGGMARRLHRVSAASEAWSRGDFSRFIDDPAGDEIGQLARRLNRMAGQLQRLLTRRQELAVSEERNRLARDLHDSAKQQALAASFQLGTALTLFERDPPAARKHLLEAERLVDSVRVELTDLIHELRPPAPDGRDLSETLNDYAVEWAHQNGIDVDLAVDGHRDLPLDVSQTLYRILQEALANVARHSGARTIAIGLDYVPPGVTLTIADDGCGFDAGRPHGGMGLDSMRERAEALGGHLAVDSQPGHGTTISATFPLPADPSPGAAPDGGQLHV